MPPSPSTVTEPSQALIRRSLTRHCLAGGATFALFFGVVGGWASTTELAGALVAPGQIVVESSVKKVQHPTGGVVGQLRVHEGDRVRAGDVLLRLDETVAKANLSIISKSLDEQLARLGRLEAERDGAEAVNFPALLSERSGDPDVTKAMVGEDTLFRLRHEARSGQKAQLGQRLGQLDDEISGLRNQMTSKLAEIAIIDRELEGVRKLWQHNLVQIQRVTQLERDAVRMHGEHGQLQSALAQAQGKRSEVALQIIQVDQDLRSEVAKDMREVQARIAEFIERKVSAQDQVNRIELRAPQDGVVHQLTVHTVGGVITPGEPVMMIVPEGDILTVEARVAPQDIDQVHPGMPAKLKFTAFNQRVTPEIHGEVLRVSPDATMDPRTGATYYTLHLSFDAQAAAQMRMVPGMPVEAYVQTGLRTALSYFGKPLMDQFNRAFLER